MSDGIFRFKEFQLYHGESSLKVTTEACLFGTLIPVQNVAYALDIGAGSGLLSFMIAQRKSDCHVTSVEVDAGSVLDIKRNI